MKAFSLISYSSHVIYHILYHTLQTNSELRSLPAGNCFAILPNGTTCPPCYIASLTTLGLFKLSDVT